jgi:hypothetical protein
VTAEIAILNKSAVALATDSAITISAGNEAQKIFDSADKLFELSSINPIGIMIYNGMHFMGIPLQSLIKEFRAKKEKFATVEKAADQFLSYLNNIGASAPEIEKNKAIIGVIDPVLETISKRIKENLYNKIQDYEKSGKTGALEIENLVEETFTDVLSSFDKRIIVLGKGRFLGKGDGVKFSTADSKLIRQCVERAFPNIPKKLQQKIVKLSKYLVNSSYMSQGKTGLIFSGFGTSDTFPTLISYEIDGVFGGRLKVALTEQCDIDRSGQRAFVRPFAQKEMVDRFLYGLDAEIQDEIVQYCAKTIVRISKEIFDRLDILDEAKRDDLLSRTKMAEEAFLRNLKDKAFSSIESSSRREIEDMVEFMPKPELAKMAEALIDLNSIKRKVSRGLETVGGPVDVAVISKSEGFVWVKRKHYFPPELNARYFDRLLDNRRRTKEGDNG